jgi:ABC-type Fe3+-siderophore transport system permease subunit
MRTAIAFAIIAGLLIFIAVVATREHQAPYAMVLVKAAVSTCGFERHICSRSNCRRIA